MVVVLNILNILFRTLWCLIVGGWNKRGGGGWKNLQNIISRWGGIAGGLDIPRNLKGGGEEREQ